MRNKALTDKLLLLQLVTRLPPSVPTKCSYPVSIATSSIQCHCPAEFPTKLYCIPNLTHAFYAQNQLMEFRAIYCSNAVPGWSNLEWA